MLCPSHSYLIARNSNVSKLGGVRLAGYEKSGKGVLQKWRTLTSFCLVYLVNGKGRYKDASGLTFSIKSGDCFISPPNIAHHYGPDKDCDWDEYFILFEGPVFDLLNEQGYYKWKRPTVSLMSIDYWADRIMNAAKRSESGDPKSLTEEVLKLQSLIADLLLVSRENLENDLAWIQRAKSSIIDSHSIPEAADIMGLKHQTFRKKFKKLSGHSPGHFRISVKMERACDLIATTQLSIKSVAEELSFCDEFHFSKQFSQMIGVSPIEYRSKTMRRGDLTPE